MPDTRESRCIFLGHLALERGLISPEDLREALAEQAGASGGGPRRPLGAILVARGLLTEAQLDDLLEDQKALALPADAPDDARRRDNRLGRLLVQNRHVTAEQVNECLRAQADAIERGRPDVPRLGEMLVQKGYAAPEAIGRALASQRTTILVCGECGRQYNIRGFDPGAAYRCPSCASPLAPLQSIDTVRVEANVVAADQFLAPPSRPAPPPPTAQRPVWEGAKAPDSPASEEISPSTPAAVYSPLGKYAILREIGEGGMGRVYEAVLFGAVGFEKTIAIKMIHEGYAAEEDYVDMFVSEAKLVADLVHTNICQVYQLDKVGKFYYIVMEYVDGVNLKDLMDRHFERRTRCPWELATFIISRVCRGLEYAHTKQDRQGRSLGIVHRDISPKNILIGAEGEVKLTDFGVAKARDLTKDREGQLLVGKAQYMSPEQAQYLATDARSDLFSLGVVMYELLTGHALFEGETTVATIQNVMRKTVLPPRKLASDIPPELERIVLRAVERDPERRYPSASEMVRDLESAICRSGFGPTLATLRDCLRELFPGRFPGAASAPAAPPSAALPLERSAATSKGL